MENLKLGMTVQLIATRRNATIVGIAPSYVTLLRNGRTWDVNIKQIKRTETGGLKLTFAPVDSKDSAIDRMKSDNIRLERIQRNIDL